MPSLARKTQYEWTHVPLTPHSLAFRSLYLTFQPHGSLFCSLKEPERFQSYILHSGSL